jgi:hypothetical protein
MPKIKWSNIKLCKKWYHTETHSIIGAHVIRKEPQNKNCNAVPKAIPTSPFHLVIQWVISKWCVWFFYMFRTRELRNIYSHVANQQMHRDEPHFIRVHLQVQGLTARLLHPLSRSTGFDNSIQMYHIFMCYRLFKKCATDLTSCHVVLASSDELLNRVK